MVQLPSCLVPSTGVALLGLLTVQNTSTVLLARYTRTKYNYNVTNMLTVAEVMKLVASFVIEIYTKKGFSSFHRHIWSDPIDALKLTIPAGLYLLQNNLVYYAVEKVPVPLFQITQQSKLITTAALSVVALKRVYTPTHWYSIVALCIGTAICILSSSSKNDVDDSGPAFSLFGLLLIVASNVSSSLAGVYFEIVIKGKPKTIQTENNQSASAAKVPPSIWMRNVQLSFFSLCIIASQKISASYNNNNNTEKEEETKMPFFYDFTPLLFIQISMFAFGGLLVASVIKYTDSVQKGLSTCISVISSSALSVVIEQSGALSMEFIFGAVMAISGCFFFGNPSLVSNVQEWMKNNINIPTKTMIILIISVITVMALVNQTNMLSSLTSSALLRGRRVMNVEMQSTSTDFETKIN